MSSGSDGAAKLRVQRLDCIRGVNDPSHAFGKGKEGDHELPVSAPALSDCWIFDAPGALRKSLEGGLAGSRIGRAIDGPQCLRDVLAILPGGKIHRMTDEMDDASLNNRLRKNRIDGLRKALQAIDDRDQNILGAAGLQLVDDAQPEFGAFG